MIISGLLIEVVPEKRREVQDMINALQGVEISSIISDEKMVVLIHSGSVKEKKLMSKMVEELDGVTGINLAYDHFECED